MPRSVGTSENVVLTWILAGWKACHRDAGARKPIGACFEACGTWQGAGNKDGRTLKYWGKPNVPSFARGSRCKALGKELWAGTRAGAKNAAEWSLNLWPWMILGKGSKTSLKWFFKKATLTDFHSVDVSGPSLKWLHRCDPLFRYFCENRRTSRF